MLLRQSKTFWKPALFLKLQHVQIYKKKLSRFNTFWFSLFHECDFFYYKVLRASNQATTWICLHTQPQSFNVVSFLQKCSIIHFTLTWSLQPLCNGVSHVRWYCVHLAYSWSRCIAYNVLLQMLFAPLTFNLHDCRNKAWVVLFTSIRINTASSCVILWIFLLHAVDDGSITYETRYSDHTYRLAYAVV